MKLISLKAVVELILSNKAKHFSERIDADDVCDFERMERIASRMDEDDDIGNKVSELPSAFEGKTNGEVIQALFPNADYCGGAHFMHITNVNSIGEVSFPWEWWNAPYKAESEEI